MNYYYTGNINHIPSVPSHYIVRTNQPNAGVVTYQSAPYYEQTYTQHIQNSHIVPMAPPNIHHYSQAIGVPYVNNGMPAVEPTRNNPGSCKDHLNTLWAICNTLFFCLPLGIIAWIISAKAAKMRRTGDDQGARRNARWATVLNAVATILGIAIIVGVVVAVVKQSKTS